MPRPGTSKNWPHVHWSGHACGLHAHGKKLVGNEWWSGGRNGPQCILLISHCGQLLKSCMPSQLGGRFGPELPTGISSGEPNKWSGCSCSNCKVAMQVGITYMWRGWLGRFWNEPHLSFCCYLLHHSVNFELAEWMSWGPGTTSVLLLWCSSGSQNLHKSISKNSPHFQNYICELYINWRVQKWIFTTSKYMDTGRNSLRFWNKSDHMGPLGTLESSTCSGI